MTPTRRSLPLRAVLVALSLAGTLYVAVAAVQVVALLRPAAAELGDLTRDLLTDHAAISDALTELREARRLIARLAPPVAPSAERPPDADALRDRVTALLDGSAARRASVERADLPVEMRLLLAEAVEQEALVSVRLLEALRAIELARGPDAVEALRRSGVHSDSTSQLLTSAHRVALRDLLNGQDQLLDRLLTLEGWAGLWAIVGALLFGTGAWVVRSRFYRPVREMESIVQRIASGDLTAEARVERLDEIGRLALHLNEMTAVLRERAEREAERRENLTERFGRLLDESSNQILVFDAGTLALLQANRGARVALGYSRDDLANLQMSDLFGGLSAERLAELVAQLRSETLPRVLLATWMRRRDGSLRPTELTVQYATDGGTPVFIAVAEDAAVRQRVRELDDRLREFAVAEQGTVARGELDLALRAITRMAADALQVSRCGVWRVEGDRRVALLGFDAESQSFRIDADPPALSGPAATTAPLLVPVRASGRLAAELALEQRGERRDWTAEERTFAGGVADLVGRALEAAERRNLEHALERAQRMDSIGQLAGGIAHDFNNILTAILGNLEASRADLPTDHPVAGALAEAEHAALRAADLTRQLLTFARHQVVETKVLDLAARARESEPMLRRLLGATVELVLEFQATPPVRLGSGQPEQLLVNLAVNARDAMPDGGRLIIGLREVTLDAALAAASPDLRPGKFAELTVRDTGTGMDAATIERAFEPFFTTKRLGEGTGLGLAVCYGIVRNAGGSIGIESVPNGGTTVRVLLPAAVERPSPGGGFRAPVRSGDEEVILLADDEAAIRALLSRMLRARGYDVRTAADGEEAVALGTRHDGPLALLITDVVMPKMSGPEAARRLRAARPGLPVLFMSGYTADGGLQEGDLVDAQFIAKPFTPEELARRVRAMLDAARSGERPSA